MACCNNHDSDMPHPSAVIAPATDDSPRILAVSLNRSASFHDDWKAVMSAIAARARFQRVKTVAGTLRKLGSSPLPDAVLITDGALIERNEDTDKILEAILGYVQNDGGRVVCALDFARSISVSSEFSNQKLTDFFRRVGLSWSYGGGSHREFVVHMNPEAESIPKDVVEDMPSRYLVRAVTLKDVARTEAWYLPGPESPGQNAVGVLDAASPSSLSEEKQDMEQTPVAFGRLGKGMFGYVSALDCELSTCPVILAMCGIKIPGLLHHLSAERDVNGDAGGSVCHRATEGLQR